MHLSLHRSGRVIVPVLVVLALLALIVLSVRNWQRSQHEGEELLVVSGSIEARYVRIASLPGGRLIELNALEGQQVSAGELLAVTDPVDLPLRIQQAEQGITEARARLELLQAGATAEELAAARHRAQAALSVVANLEQGSRAEDIAAARSAVDIALTQLADARDEVARLEVLFDSGVVEERRLVAARAQVEALQAGMAASMHRLELLENGPREEEIEQARQQAAAAQSEYERLVQGARPQELDAAQAAVDGLEAGRSALLRNLEESNVLASAAGEIVSVPVNAGDLLSPGQTICELLLPESVYIQTFIPENRIGWLSIGSQLEYVVDGVPGTARGTVEFISPEAEFTPRNLQTTQKRVAQVFRVKLAPEAGGTLHQGLICDIRIPAPEARDGSDG